MVCRFDELMGDILEMDYMYFKPLVDSISDMNIGNDWFLVANDFASYLDCQARPPNTSASLHNAKKVLIFLIWPKPLKRKKLVENSIFSAGGG